MKLKCTETHDELNQILEIQKENHYNNVSKNFMNDKGFVTVLHSFKMLKKMHTKAPQIIAKEHGQVVAYALVMLKEFKTLIPALSPMFKTIEKINFKGEALNSLSFYVMGQICVKDQYKRKGLFKKLYLKHKELYSDSFEYCITEVSSSNKPSMMAHQKIGFQTIYTFKDTTDEWKILLWDWNETKGV